MQGVKQQTQKLFYQFSLDDHVPSDHYYRKIDQALDLRFLYERTAHYYGTDGQQSIDPVVFFKMCLVGYLNNIAGDRALVRYCSDSLSARWFIGYDIDEALPVHSTLSRTRALFDEHLYEQVFRAVLALCIEAGMVSGKRQVVDSALVGANASLDSMQRKNLLEDASAWCRQTLDENPAPAPAEGQPAEQQEPSAPETSLERVELPDSKTSKPKRSNKTHQSSTDPDARMTRKPGKPTDLYYRGQLAADASEGVITAAMADFGDREDHEALAGLLEKIGAHLAPYPATANPETLIADSKYNTVHSLQACEEAQITAYMPNPSGYKSEREGFTYDPEADCYRCEQGVELPFKRIDKNRGGRYANKVYQSKPSDCEGCPLAGACLSGKSNYKTLTHSTGKVLYDQMHERLQTRRGKYLMGKRKGTIEPVFGNLLWHYGMRKVFARGLPAADKHVKMAAMAYNLTKWLKKPASGPFGKAAAMEKSTCMEGSSGFSETGLILLIIYKYFTTDDYNQPPKTPKLLF